MSSLVFLSPEIENINTNLFYIPYTSILIPLPLDLRKTYSVLNLLHKRFCYSKTPKYYPSASLLHFQISPNHSGLWHFFFFLFWWSRGQGKIFRELSYPNFSLPSFPPSHQYLMALPRGVTLLTWYIILLPPSLVSFHSIC